jgi:hypothetical protein
MIRRNREIVSLDGIVADLLSKQIIYAPLDGRDQERPRIGQVMRQVGWSSWVGMDRAEVSFEGIVLESWGKDAHSDIYHLITEDEEIVHSSFVGCLRLACERAGVTLMSKIEEDHLLARYAGKPSEREGLQPGAEFRQGALRLALA